MKISDQNQERLVFKMDDPVTDWVPRAAARSPTRKRVPGRTVMYVDESDAATTKVCT